MGRYQLGRELPREDVAALAAFLRTLSGEWRGRPVR
jgi:cytochrome c peroxidase